MMLVTPLLFLTGCGGNSSPNITANDFALTIEVKENKIPLGEAFVVSVSLRNNSGRAVIIHASGDFFVINLPGTLYDDMYFTQPAVELIMQADETIEKQFYVGQLYLGDKNFSNWLEEGIYALSITSNFFVGDINISILSEKIELEVANGIGGKP